MHIGLVGFLVTNSFTYYSHFEFYTSIYSHLYLISLWVTQKRRCIQLVFLGLLISEKFTDNKWYNYQKSQERKDSPRHYSQCKKATSPTFQISDNDISEKFRFWQVSSGPLSDLTWKPYFFSGSSILRRVHLLQISSLSIFIIEIIFFCSILIPTRELKIPHLKSCYSPSWSEQQTCKETCQDACQEKKRGKVRCLKIKKLT